MNLDYILYNMREAHKDLGRAIEELVAESTHYESDLYLAMQHVYHHLNTAWNARHSTPEQSGVCTAEDFHRWRQYPPDLDQSPE